MANTVIAALLIFFVAWIALSFLATYLLCRVFSCSMNPDRENDDADQIRKLRLNEFLLLHDRVGEKAGYGYAWELAFDAAKINKSTLKKITTWSSEELRDAIAALRSYDKQY